MVELYTEQLAMPAEKTIAVSFRVSPRFKLLLQAAAANQRRSQTNMLETLLFDFCEQQGIALPEMAQRAGASSKGGTTK
jgi:hypothetical protein